MKKRVVAYIRVSTEEQAEHGYSLEVQEQVLKDYAKGHDLEIVATFIEKDSAFKPGRREYARMLNFFQKDRTTRTVLVYKIDRLARNTSDYAYLVETLGIEIISATEQLPSNSAGRYMADVQVANSRFYSAQLSERVKPAMAAKAKKGLYPSYAPLGYVNDRLTRTIVHDPERAPLVKELFDTYAETEMSLLDLTHWAKMRGLRTRKGQWLQRSTIHKLLSNPIYKGVVRWNGVISPGSHPPIVTDYLFERVQEKLTGRGHIQGRHHFPFRGLLVCGFCGCQITTTQAKGKYVYYHCTNGHGKCSQPYIRQEALSKKLQSVVDNVRIPEDVVRQLLDQIKAGEDERRASIRRKLEGFKIEAAGLVKRRDQAYVDKLDGVISEERWQEMDGEWTSQLDGTAKSIAELETALLTSGTDDAREAFELLEHASELYSRQPFEEQARGLKILVSNCRLTGENVEPNYRKPFDLVAEGVRSGTWYA
jgi:DNA invertase Pin-like site-specific DNA recombinase